MINNNITIDVPVDIQSYLISSCMYLQPEYEIHDAFDKTLLELCNITGANIACVFRIDEKNNMSVFSEQIINGNIDTMSLVLKKIKPFLLLEEAQKGVYITTEKDFLYYKNNYPDLVFALSKKEFSSVIIYPMIIPGGDLIGYIFLGDAKEKLKTLKQTLKILSVFLTTRLSMSYILKKLKTLSNTDLMTNVLNRNALNLRLKTPANGPYGVLYADVNGLKATNDKYGHEAGDALIKSAAYLLSSIFNEDEIYRAGGDEFIIVSKRSKKEFEDKIIELEKSNSSSIENGVCLSIGYVYTDDEDLDDAIKKADKLMYKEKESWHKNYRK